ncbi:LacI family DNA-binding transcriptional regulator [Dinghuibacter silviterrae]|uniref:LacI family transcriptional regulator n=1 Tax=Dinghuibacter silviterrae TaxID=1539049 RepID=A0A4R8DH62_9BACT|nr:LacI family DNA-binding transcriptional regulator [Dinghuibacter silviterrae]TDW96446.1 LacI family transcriptional regulator [Dinghuibacter silviterrae]
MRYEAITIKDIAKALNLSISTVSKALRDSYEISEDTKDMVKAYARDHNYKPNPIAQSLKKGLSKSIGVVVCNIDNHFFSQAINGMEVVAGSRGYNVIITQTHESFEREVANVRHLSSRSIDGLIVSLSAETEDIGHFKQLHDQGLPIVFFDRVTPEIKTHTVISGNFKGAYDATLHLVAQGYTRIAQITSANQLSITLERLEGYRQALADSGIPLRDEYVRFCPHGGMIQAETEQAIRGLLALDPRPEAILTASDRLSTTTFSLLKEMQVAIPGEMAIVGFTNSVSAHIFDPPFSAIMQPAFDMGKQSMELLVQLIEAKRPVTEFERRVLDVELRIRASSQRAR